VDFFFFFFSFFFLSFFVLILLTLIARVRACEMRVVSCCYVPTWFGVSATTFLGLLASECSDSWSAGWFAAFIMAIVPAHIMRSVGGGYDNESVALTALTGTFYCWCRALRDDPKVRAWVVSFFVC
jgi:asparagine N-glycosylation enzyme membrane subunit Stt3